MKFERETPPDKAKAAACLSTKEAEMEGEQSSAQVAKRTAEKRYPRLAN